MRLRHQLMLVSLLILCLPWAGCQFVREMESAMLQGQERALLASATAVSLRLADDETLGLSTTSAAVEDNPVYFHALTEAPVIDGFDDDWRNFPIAPGRMSSDQPASLEENELEIDTPSIVYSGVYRGLSYLFIRVPDETVDYLDPSKDPLRSGDYVRVIRSGQSDLYLGASAPGNVNARYLEDDQVRPEYSLSGVWNHTGVAYQIELRMRPRLLDQTLGIEYVDTGSNADSVSYRIGLGSEQPLHFVGTDPELAEALEIFASEGLRLAVVDKQQWLLAQAGNLRQGISEIQKQHGLLTWIYQMILKDTATPPMPSWDAQGRLDSEDIERALKGEDAVARFSLGDLKVGRGSVPVFRDNSVVGAVVVEQTTDSLTNSTNQAFNRLLFWSLLSMLIVGFGLLLYASLLSYRIRSLSKAAERATDDNGKILSGFPVSKFSDEVGDLSRSFDQLLNRLREYTDYLKTLSGKLSHELKTPLAVVRSSLDNLEQQDLSDEVRVYTDRARDGASRLSAIFAALSSATRLEESIHGAELENVNLAEMLGALRVAYADAYPAQNIRLCIAPEAADIEMMVAPELIVQMLDKLVDNAADFCVEDGEITLSMQREQTHCRIDVSNDGPLLPKEMQKHLFESLVSVRSAKSEDTDFSQAPHLGLGMYIARLIAEFHGGTIVVDNREDQAGVVVSVRLPFSV